MRVTYVLLSPTFGMHQYTADLANRMAAAGHDVHLVTTTGYPVDRYAPAVQVRTPLTSTGTGFSPEGLNLPALRRILAALPAPPSTRQPSTRGQATTTGQPYNDEERSNVQTFKRSNEPLPRSNVPFTNLQPSTSNFQPSVVHITGVHLWNLFLVHALRRRGIPTLHTLHDLDPHHGRRFGGLIRLWNQLIIASGCHLLVHGRRYRERLLARGVAEDRVTYAPLLHLFLAHGAAHGAAQEAAVAADPLGEDVRYEPWALFFGRLLPYKGVGDLVQAQARLDRRGASSGVTLAGSGDLARVWDGPLPAGVALRNRLIDDPEALDLFRRCGLLVLPYRDATQSALIAAAYFFRKPVIVTDVGALPEYVDEGRTGWVVPPGDPAALAACLAHALADPAGLERMGAAGRAWYERERAREWETLVGLYGEATARRFGVEG